ncbi:TolC family protein [Arcticibacter tournemirensis]|nr:TolC family protein [Arcticibacter tournemirensis]
MRKTLLIILFFGSLGASAQSSRTITVDEAIRLGIENSKALKVSQSRIDEAVSRFNQAKDRALPTASASYAFSHANFLSGKFELPGSTNEPLDLPSKADAFIGTLSVQETIFAGNKLKYAKESTDLLTSIARLDADKQKDNIAYNIITACYNLYKVEQSQKVVEQNLQAVDQQIKQAQQFFSQGLVTKNDVLRFQLQKNNIQLTGVDLETNKKIVNYNLDILLGLPENTELEIKEFGFPATSPAALVSLIDTALNNREEIKDYVLRSQLAETNIKTVKADLMPTLSATGSMYYINPTGKFVPKANTFLAPVSVGATLAWSIDRLWTNKHKVSEAQIQKNEAEIGKGITTDNVKTEVNQDYQNFTRSVERIKILENSIQQAAENDRILESKYRNNIASVTDRIDAQTQLFQSQINLELAKADAGLAWYTLRKSTGTIKQR